MTSPRLTAICMIYKSDDQASEVRRSALCRIVMWNIDDGDPPLGVSSEMRRCEDGMRERNQQFSTEMNLKTRRGSYLWRKQSTPISGERGKTRGPDVATTRMCTAYG